MKNYRSFKSQVSENLLNKTTMTPEQIAKKHGVDVLEIEKQLKIGISVEKEHTKKEDVAREIALDHLGEDPKYYAKLKKYVESVIKIGTLIEDSSGKIGKVVSVRENSIVFNVAKTGMMRSVSYNQFKIVEAIGHIATGAPDYFFADVPSAPQDKQEEAGHSDPSPQDKDIGGKKHTTPSKYYRGLEKDTKERRYSHFRKQTEKSWKDPSAYTDAPGDKEARQKGMPQSKHTEKYHALYDERINNSINVDKNMNEEAEKGLAKKAKESGISLQTLRKVYNRGMAAWRGGHRPGTTPQQWGMARVNSYITKGKGTYYGADSDLSGQSKKKQKNENISTDYVGTGMNVPYYGAYDKVEVHNESKDIDKMFEAFLEENVHALDTNMESHLFGTDAARIAAQQMTPGEPGYVGMGKEASNFTYSREGEESNKEKKKSKTSKEKDEEEDYPGGDYNSRLSGASRAEGGLGGAYSIGVQEENLPRVPSIRAWALKESTQRNFFERYGDKAAQKLIEAAQRMTKAKSSFTNFRQKLDEADYAPQEPRMGSGSNDFGAPPETGYAKQAFGEEGEIHAAGTKVRVPHKGNMVSGKIVRHDPGDKHGSPFYIVDVGDYESAKIAAHKVQKEEINEDIHQEIQRCLTEGVDFIDNNYRLGSEKFFEFFRTAREMNLQLEGYNKYLIEQTDIGEIAEYNGQYVPLDCPMISEEEEKKTPPLNQPKRGGTKKFYVYVRDPQTNNIKKVSWGDTTGLSVKMNNPEARKSFAARHRCSMQKDRTTAAYWACNTPRYAKQLGLSGGGNFYW